MLFLAESNIECGKCRKPIRLYKDNGSVFVAGATYETKCPHCEETNKYLIGALVCNLIGVDSESTLPTNAAKATPLNGELSDVDNMPHFPELAVLLN